jgi:hypothetical protein
MPSYYIGFDVIVTNDLGIPEKQAGVTVDVYNETDSASLGTLTTDDFGVIPAGSFPVATGKVVLFTVSGYAGEIRRTTTATADEAYVGITDLTLELESTFTPTPAPTVYNEIWGKSATEANPVLLGTAAPGEILKYPYNPAVDGALDLFAIAKTEQGLADVFGLQSAVSTVYTTNRENGTPDFSQDGAALNLQIDFVATGYSVAKFRKVQWDTVNTFDSVDIADRTKIEGNLNQALSPNFNITRPGPEPASLAVFVRIAHSTTNQSFGAWSAIKGATFADNGGSGGSGGGTPPMDLNYSQVSNMIYLNWTDGSGTNAVYRNGVFVSSASGFFNDALSTPGYYEYFIQNADGSSNTISIYYSGYEF